MRFMALIRGPENAGEPPAALFAAIDDLIKEAGRVVVDTGGLKPSADGARIRIRDGRVLVTDGPFAETKEVIGGYAVLELPSRDAAVAWTERFMRLHVEHWPGWEGETELRPMEGAEAPDAG